MERDTQKHIVYRSRMEKEMDEFWWSDEGQSYMLYGGGAIILGAILFWTLPLLWNKIFKRNGYSRDIWPNNPR